MATDGMAGYFPLAEQFHTQSDPAYCGLGSLVMALNALAIDPERLWKGAWRWFAEDMLDCCLVLFQNSNVLRLRLFRRSEACRPVALGSECARTVVVAWALMRPIGYRGLDDFAQNDSVPCIRAMRGGASVHRWG